MQNKATVPFGAPHSTVSTREYTMNTYLMKKAMIESAISRGIRDMEEDPERSVRRLVDLGKQFSKNRFQSQIFAVMQEILDNENSAYYDMVHNLIKNSDQMTLTKFGVNYGYMGWTYGADKIRKEQRQEQVCIPWSIKLRFDASGEDGLTVAQMARLMEQGQDLGIYVYFIREVGCDNSYALLELLERYKDCAFIWLKEDGCLTAAQIQLLHICKNTLVSLPIEDSETLLTAALLRDQKIPFAMSASYDDNCRENDMHPLIESVLASETAICFLIARDGTIQSACPEAYKSRMEQQYPCVLIDYYGDSDSASRVVCEHENTLEIGADGTVLRPACSAGKAFPFDKPLMDALHEVMPAFPAK